MVSDTNTGNGGRMTDVPNVDESVVNDVTQGGIMTEVRTDVNVNDGKDDRVANDDSGDSEVLTVLTDVCNDAEYGVCGNGDGSTMDKVVRSDVEFETDESKEGGEVVDVCSDINVENDTNDMNEKDMKRSGSVVADVCNANIEIDVNRSGKVVVEGCSDANIENDRNRSGGLVSDMCDDVNIEKDMNKSEGIVVDVCTDVSIEKDVRRSVGVSTDVCNEANTKKDVNRSGGIAVDVCNNVNIENGMNMSGGVLVDVCSDVNDENGMNMSGGVLVDVCSDVNDENGMNMSGGVLVDVCSDVNDENGMNMSGGVLVDVCSDVNDENGMNMSGGVLVDVCSDVNDENGMNMSGGVLVDVCSDVNDENGMNMSGGVLVDVCSDVNIGKDSSTSEGVPAGMCSDVCNDVSTKNDVNRSGCVVVDVWNDVDFEKDVSCRSGVLGDMCSGANIENGVNRFGGVVVDARSDVNVVDEGVSFDVCGDANVVNDADRSACTYANMEYNTNRTRDVMMDVRSDVNVEDEVSATANSENDGTRDVLNKAGVSATCCLKIVSLNVCGLMSKMKYPEFCEMLVSNDIICLTETKMDDLDSFDFDGFTCFMKNRSIYKRKSGGIALLVRNQILNMVKIVEHVDFKRRIEKRLRKFYRFVDFCVFNDGLFFELPCDTQNDTNCKKLLVCALYIPPEGSVYSNRSSFTELEETLLHINLDNVLIMGDLNARTGDSSDYIWDTAALDNVLDDVSTTELMKMYNIQQDRRSQDVGKNNFGHALIDFCITQRLLIVNGRVGGDADLGKLTCKNASLVDYVIASPWVFPCICDFYVGDFDECLSDIHCPVFIKLKTGTDSHKTIHNVNVSQGMMGFAKPVWRPGVERDYLAEIDEGGVEVIYDRMQKLLESTDSINQSDIDDITDGICSLLTNAAVRLDMYQSQTCMREDKGKKNQNEPRRQEIKKNKYPWFDAECKKKRAEYRKAKGMHKSHDNYYTKGERARAHKEYKKVLNRKSRMHTKVFHERIRSLRSSDPRAYWRILNSNNRQKKHTVDAISHDLFVEHFQKLGNIPEEEFYTFDNETDIFVHDDLENDISADEVLKCIKKLKNNKSCGYDGILNEFLKTSSSKLLIAVTTLFNIVLQTGKIPHAWSIGYISPIYKGKGEENDPDNYRGITVLSCFGKLFTSVINDRIHSFLETNDILGNEQSGFRKGHSTMDHVFALHCLIDVYLQRKKKLFCAFIDYKKAFDSVQRGLLWGKLLNSGVNGKVLHVIRDMYAKAKSCVKTRHGLSQFFVSNVGLRQGENLSPVLFSLFLNDLKGFLTSNNVQGLKLPFALAQDVCLQDIDNFLYLFLLLYADDTIVLAECPEDLQRALDILKIYRY